MSASVQAAGPVVYRGGVQGPAAEQLVDTRYGVSEIRGTTVAAAAPTETAVAAPQAPAVVGGKYLWVLDATSGEMTVCRLYHGSITGDARIKCTDGEM